MLSFKKLILNPEPLSQQHGGIQRFQREFPSGAPLRDPEEFQGMMRGIGIEVFGLSALRGFCVKDHRAFGLGEDVHTVQNMNIKQVLEWPVVHSKVKGCKMFQHVLVFGFSSLESCGSRGWLFEI